MKFGHIADVHLGAWRDDSLNEVGLQTFEAVMQEYIREEVDFILVVGDLFDSSYPKIDILKYAARIFKMVQDAGIPIYVIAGSHDYSPTGKTILTVFENGAFLVNVFRADYTEDDKILLEFTIDPKTKAKITGVLGRIRGTDVGLYQELDRKSLEQEEGFKIFLFHNVITELKTKEMKDFDSFPQSLLPDNFNYYAGGHVHEPVPEEVKQGNYTNDPLIVYPGCLFPTDFKEMELGTFGGYCLVETGGNGDVTVQWKTKKLLDVLPLSYDAQGKPLETIVKELNTLLQEADLKDKIITLRVVGEMSSGSPAKINFRKLSEMVSERGGVNFMRNTQKLTSKETVIIRPDTSGKSRSEVEEKLIEENIGKVGVKAWNRDREAGVIRALLAKGSYRRGGDQKVKDYEDERWKLFIEILGIQQIWEKYEEP